jgi:hypothetical protein
MPSPLPGMNPYLEQESVWHDFHERCLPAAAEVLAARVDLDYVVRIDERICAHELPASNSGLFGRAYVAVSRPPESTPRPVGPAVLEAPAHVGLPRVDVERLGFLEIRDRESWQVITVSASRRDEDECASMLPSPR